MMWKALISFMVLIPLSGCTLSVKTASTVTAYDQRTLDAVQVCGDGYRFDDQGRIVSTLEDRLKANPNLSRRDKYEQLKGYRACVKAQKAGSKPSRPVLRHEKTQLKAPLRVDLY